MSDVFSLATGRKHCLLKCIVHSRTIVYPLILILLGFQVDDPWYCDFLPQCHENTACQDNCPSATGCGEHQHSLSQRNQKLVRRKACQSTGFFLDETPRLPSAEKKLVRPFCPPSLYVFMSLRE